MARRSMLSSFGLRALRAARTNSVLYLRRRSSAQGTHQPPRGVALRWQLGQRLGIEQPHLLRLRRGLVELEHGLPQAVHRDIAIFLFDLDADGAAA